MEKNISNKPVILFRKNVANKVEYEQCSALFSCYSQRTAIPADSVVIGRYSVLPYYNELENDLAVNNCSLINNLYEHEYIANMDYYYDIAEHTFPTWFRMEDIPFSLRESAFVLKGKTNSKKQQWNTKMLAKSFKDAVLLSTELTQDGLIGNQGLIVRQYIPLETFDIGINDLPITNEWRLFFYKETLLTYGYYWQDIAELNVLTKVDEVKSDLLARGIPFAKKVAKILSENTNFFVIDIARTQDNSWIVVEVNDGQMSGLNGINPHDLYLSLIAQF